MSTSKSVSTLTLAGLLLAAAAVAAPTGRIEGRLTRDDGSALAGVDVTAVETSEQTTSGPDGRFVLDVRPGNYTVRLESGRDSEEIFLVAVPWNGTTQLERTLGWPAPRRGKARAVSRPTTFVPGRRAAERAAPPTVALSTAENDAVQLGVPHGQLPKLVEHDAAVSTAASSRYGFDLNVRGFDGAANRRTKVLVDGRDTSEVFFGGQEWASLAFLALDLERLELERGPSSALAGANAAGGLLHLVTRQPAATDGEVHLAGGEQDSRHAEGRFAFALTDRAYLRILGSERRDDGFSVSRRGGVEYSVPCVADSRTDCLPKELVDIDPDGHELTSGALRFDQHFAGGPLLTVATGAGDVAGPVILSDLGRQQVQDAVHGWGRAHYSSAHWSFLGSYKNRDVDHQTALATGGNLALDNTTWKGELETRWSFAEDRLLLTAGVSREDERIDSLDLDGPTRPSLLNGLNQQTLLFEPKVAATDAFFARLDWHLADRLELTLAGRYEDSSLYDPQFSPRISLAWALDDGHTLRFTYHEGFVAPSHAQLSLNFDLEPARNPELLTYP